MQILSKITESQSEARRYKQVLHHVDYTAHIPADVCEQMDNERCPVREYRVLAFQGPMRIPVYSHDAGKTMENLSRPNARCKTCHNHGIRK